MKFIENPRHMCDRVFEMVKEITARIKMLKMELKSRGRETVPLEFLTSRLIFSSCFGLLHYILGNSYGHVVIVSSPNHFFSLGKLEHAVNQYFVHILLLVMTTTHLE